MRSLSKRRPALGQRNLLAVSPLLLSVLVLVSGCETFEEYTATTSVEDQPALPVVAPAAINCPTASNITVDPAKPKVTVSYVEPEVKAESGTQLAKTTIYIDSGKGGKKVMDVPASSPTGGGTITKSVGLRGKPGAKASLCVTATDTAGRESTPTQ